MVFGSKVNFCYNMVCCIMYNIYGLLIICLINSSFFYFIEKWEDIIDILKKWVGFY